MTTTTADPYDLYGTRVDGIVYRGTSSKATPDGRDVGYTMWTEDIQQAAAYCSREGAIWMLDLRDAPYIGDHIDDIKTLILTGYNAGALPCDMETAIDCGLADGEALDNVARAIAECYDPRDIVDSAEAWDNWDWIEWLYDRYLEPRGITALRTRDGGIVLGSATTAVDTGLTEW